MRPSLLAHDIFECSTPWNGKHATIQCISTVFRLIPESSHGQET